MAKQTPQDKRRDELIDELLIYTTNAIESLNRSLRKVIKTKGAFPTEASILKIFYLALANIAKKWTMPIRCWTSAMNQFAIKFADRMPL
jgi:putative transposase